MSSKPTSARLLLVDFKDTDFPPQLISLQCKVADTHSSDDPSLRSGRRVNVLKQSAAYALGNTDRADVIVKAGGYILASTGIDGDCRAVLQSTVNAELDASQGLVGRMDRQYLGFTVVNIGRAAGMTYSLAVVARVLIGGSIAIIGGPVVLSGGFIVRNGGSIDRDGEDSADDGEKLCREHHGEG